MYYIVEPECHGNGGWCGSHVVKKCRTLKSALKFDPNKDRYGIFNERWEPSFNPYGTGVLNGLCICKDTDDPNYSAFIWDCYTYSWRAGDYPNGKPADKPKKKRKLG